MSQTAADLIRALVERGAPDQAETLADASLPSSSGTERAELLFAQVGIFANRGEYLRALIASVEAGELFREAGLQARVCDALVQTATTLRFAGDHSAALSTLEQAEVLARAGGDGVRVAKVLRQIGVVSSVLGRHQHALSCLEEAVATFERDGAQEERRHAQQSLLNARSRALDGQPDGPELRAAAEAQLADWVTLAQEAEAGAQARLAVMAWGNHAITLRLAGRHREAVEAFRALLPRYHGFGMKPNEGLTHAELAHCHRSLGEMQLALQHYRASIALLREAGVQDDLLEALEGLAECEESLGDAPAAFTALKELRALEKQRKDEAARQALLQRELRVELARLTDQWARQAVQDPLTGLANRRALERWINEHWPRTELGQHLSLVLLDLDHFKRINDTFGHDTGDGVLQQVAQLLKAQCRATDLAVRYGGEEFLFALAGTDLQAAAPLAERLRAAIAGRDWARWMPKLEVTASFGVAEAGEALDAQSLLTLADRRLYAAKFAGRNRVVASG